MNILVISQYFWPENFRVNDMCLELKQKGNNVIALTGKPNYPSGKFSTGYGFFKNNYEIWRGIKIYRVGIIPRGKGNRINLILNYISFALFSSLRILFLKIKIDKIIVYQLSPATVGFPGIIAKKKYGAPIFFYIQDLWPESLTDAGEIKSKYILNAVDSMMNIFYNHSHQIWVQSIGFTTYLINKGVNPNKIKYLPNTVESFYIPQEVLYNYKNKFPKGFNILFAGNIGVAQDFKTIMSAASEISKKKLPINFIIIGDGRERKKYEDSLLDSNLFNCIFFLGSFPSEEMPYYFACADVLLVSLKDSLIFSLTIPSKLQSYLACGKPILGNINGVGANIIIESKSGYCSPSGNYIELTKNIEAMYAINSNDMKSLSENAYNYYKQEFDRTIIYEKLINYLNI